MNDQDEKELWLSDCCGAEASGSMIDVGICPDCHEHCEFIQDTDETYD